MSFGRPFSSSGAGLQAGVVQGDDEVALAVVSADPGDLVPAGGDVFAPVRIAPADDHGVPAPCPHHVPDPFDPAGVKILHKTDSCLTRCKLRKKTKIFIGF